MFLVIPDVEIDLMVKEHLILYYIDNNKNFIMSYIKCTICSLILPTSNFKIGSENIVGSS